jgi:tRNA pseudouridine55 synthase
MDGMILVDKTKGCTSHDVIASLRRVLKTRKLGHTGTLDPDATGLLIVLSGKATKLSRFIMSDGKTYRTMIRLGIETDSFDASGKIVSTAQVSGISRAEVEEVLESFTGEIRQTVPVVSAVKVKGKPLYKYARQGIDVDPPEKTVVIHKIELLSMDTGDEPTLDIIVECGSGTYIRSLASDIGRALGCGAHVADLRRLSSGPYSVDTAHTVDEIEQLFQKGAIDDFLIPMNGSCNDR